MRIKEIHLIGSLFLAVFISIVLISLNSASADQTTATYIGSDQCSLCHNTQFNQWDETSHGIYFFDDSEWLYDGNLTNKYTRCGDSMLPCHTIGYNDIDKFSFFFWGRYLAFNA